MSSSDSLAMADGTDNANMMDDERDARPQGSQDLGYLIPSCSQDGLEEVDSLVRKKSHAHVAHGTRGMHESMTLEILPELV